MSHVLTPTAFLSPSTTSLPRLAVTHDRLSQPPTSNSQFPLLAHHLPPVSHHQCPHVSLHIPSPLRHPAPLPPIDISHVLPSNPRLETLDAGTSSLSIQLQPTGNKGTAQKRWGPITSSPGVQQSTRKVHTKYTRSTCKACAPHAKCTRNTCEAHAKYTQSTRAPRNVHVKNPQSKRAPR